MKSLWYTLLIFFVTGCALEQISPSDYNDAIFVQQMKVKNLITELTKAPDDSSRKVLVKKLQVQALESLKEVKEIGPFRGDESLLKDAIPLFEFYLELSVELLNAPVTQVPAMLDANLKRQMDKEQDFLKGQGRFAEKYDLFM